MSRKPLGNSVRFEVFKRDGFACQYCGAHPPDVVLEVDHIDPVSAGGTNDEGNLVTACFNCNRGKAARLLSVAPESLAARAARVAEAEAQLAGYRDIMRAQQDRKEADVWEVIEALYGEQETTHVRYQSVANFLERLPLERVLEAARIARGAYGIGRGRARRFKYFCGVCWRMVGEAEA